MTWWPRQTPSTGRRASAAMSRQTPVSSGRPGPGLRRTPSKAATSVRAVSVRSRTTQSAPSSRRYATIVWTKLSRLSTTRTRRVADIRGSGSAGPRGHPRPCRGRTGAWARPTGRRNTRAGRPGRPPSPARGRPFPPRRRGAAATARRTSGTGLLHPRRGRHELAEDDEALRRGVFRVAGGQCDHPLGGVGPRVLGHRGGDAHVTGLYDLGRGDLVDVLAGPGVDQDPVAAAQLAQPVEGREVGRAVAGHDEVADLAGHRGAGVVAGPLAQVGDRDALDDHVVETLAEPGDADQREAVPETYALGGDLAGGGSGVPGAAQLVAQLVLLRLGVRAGAPELVRDEEQQDEAGRDAQLADATDE